MARPVGEISVRVTPNLDGFAASLRRAVGQLLKPFEKEIQKSLAAALDPLLDDVAEQGREIATTLSESMADGIDLSNVTETIRESLDPVAEIGGELAEALDKGLGQLEGTIGSSLGRVLQQARSLFAGGDLERSVRDGLAGAVDATRSLAEDATATFGRATDAVRSGIDRIRQAAKDKVVDLAGLIDVEQIATGLDEVVAGVQAGLAATHQAAAQGVGRIGSVLRGLGSRLVPDDLAAAFTRLGQQVVQVATGLGRSLSVGLAGAGERVRAFVASIQASLGGLTNSSALAAFGASITGALGRTFVQASVTASRGVEVIRAAISRLRAEDLGATLVPGLATIGRASSLLGERITTTLRIAFAQVEADARQAMGRVSAALARVRLPNLGPALSQGLTAVGKAASALSARVTGALSGLAPIAQRAGASIGQALSTGLGTVGRGVQSVAQTLGDGLTSALKKVASGAQQAAQQVGQALTSGLRSAAAGAVQLAAGIGRTISSGVTAAVATAQSSLAGLGLAVAGVTAGMGALATKVVQTGTSYNTLEQTARVSFKTILGSTQAAEGMMESISEFARGSPFAREVFIQGTRQMLSFGFAAEDVIPTLGAVQDAVAAMGGSGEQISSLVGTFSQIQSSGRLMGGDLTWMGQMGINAAKLLASEFGTTEAAIRDMATRGLLTAEKAIPALVNAMGDAFGGAAAGVKETMTGAVDRIRGAFRDISSKILEPFVKKGGGGLMVEWANTVADVLRRLEKTVVPLLAIAFGRLAEPIDRVFKAVDNVVRGFDAFGEAGAAAQLEQLHPALVGIADALDPAKFIEFLTEAKNLAPVLAPLVAMLGALGGGSLLGQLPIIGGVFQGMAGPIGLLVTGFGALVASSPKVRGALLDVGADLFDTIGDLASSIMPLLQSLAPAMESVATSIVRIVGGALEQILPVIGTVVESLAPVITRLADAVLPVILQLAGAFTGIIEVVGPSLTRLFEVLADSIGGIAGALGPVIEAVGSGLGAVIGALVNSLATVLDVLGPALESVFGALGPLIETMGQSLASVFGLLGPIVADLIGRLGPVIADLLGAIGPVIEQVATMLGPVMATIGEVFASLAETIGPVLTDLIGTIGPVLGQIIAAVVPVIGALAEAIGPVLEALGPVLGTLAEQIGAIFVALAPVISDVLGALGPVIATLAEALGPILELVGGAIVSLVETLGPVIVSLAEGLGPVIEVIAGVISRLVEALGPILEELMPVIGDMAEILGAAILSVLQALAPALLRIVDAIAPLLTPETIQALLGLVSPWLLLLPVLEPLGRVFGLLAERVGTVVVGLVEKLGPVIPVIADAVIMLVEALGEGLAEVLTALFEATEPLIPVLIDVADIFAGVLIDVLRDITPILGDVVSALGDGLVRVIEAIAPSLPQLGAAFGAIALALGDLLIALVPIIPPLVDLALMLVEKLGVPFLLLLAKVFVALATALAKIVPPIAEILAAGLGDIVEFWVDLVEALSRGDIGGMLEVIGEQFSQVGGLIVQALGAAIKAIFRWVSDHQEEIRDKFTEWAGAALSWLGDMIGKIPGLLLSLLGAIGRWAIEHKADVAMKFAEWGGKALSWVGDAVLSIPARLAALVSAIAAWAVTAGPQIALSVAGFVGSVLSWIGGAILAAPGKLAELGGAIIGWVTGLPGQLATAAGDIFAFLWTNAQAGVDLAVAFFTGLPGRLLALLTTIGDAALDLGEELISKIVEGITTLAGVVEDFGRNIANGIIGFINDNIIGKINNAIDDVKLEVAGVTVFDGPKDFLPTIPELARGALIQPSRGGTLARLAEAGYPEVAIPINPSLAGRRRAQDLADESGLSSLLGASSGDGGIHIDNLVVQGGSGGRLGAMEVLRQIQRRRFLGRVA